MICRLVIILIVIANPTNNNTISFLLVSSTTVLALIHLIFRPYANNVLNIFDGMILQLMSLVSALPLVGSAYPDVLLAIVIIFLMLPITTFTTMELIKELKELFPRLLHMYTSDLNQSIPVTMMNFQSVILVLQWMII